MSAENLASIPEAVRRLAAEPKLKRPRIPNGWRVVSIGTNEAMTTIRHNNFGGIVVTAQMVEYRWEHLSTHQRMPTNAVRAAIALHEFRMAQKKR